MKLTYIGAGAVRIIPDIRLMMQTTALRSGDEIALFDISMERAQITAEILKQSPEFKSVNIKLTISDNLDASLEGADFVYFVIRPWRTDVFERSCRLCWQAGFIGSDNVSLSGSLMSAIGIPIAISIAKRMESLCPRALLVIFSNPIAMLTYAVRKTTKIRAIGVCAGFSNHTFDLPNIMNWPGPDDNFEIDVAGTNHLSWILKCKYKNQDFYPQLDSHIAKGVTFDRIKDNDNLIFFLSRMVEAYQTYGAMLFSSEPDGLSHVNYYDEYIDMHQKSLPKDDNIAAIEQEMRKYIDKMKDYAQNGVPAKEWQSHTGALGVYTQKAIGPMIIGGFTGRDPNAKEVAVSAPNNGAVADFPADAVMEYSQKMVNGELVKKNSYKLPKGLVGITQAIIEHQSLITDSILSNDRGMFMRGMYAYPMLRSFARGNKLISSLLDAAKPQLPEFLKK